MKLSYDLPGPGVWLLTGANGSGKTSLLAALRRIGYQNAFPLHYPSSKRDEGLDTHSSASVEYIFGDRSVRYEYTGVRWEPRPKTNKSVLQDFPFAAVLYIGANADRITPKPEDFSANRAKVVKKYIVDGANYIFGTEKFSNLRQVNVTRGVNPAFVLKMGAKSEYYSERNFSLGELCVLKMLRTLEACKARSLILIDELEMALHPQAQIALYKFLTKEAKSRSHTVIFSTHSASLIKHASRDQIVYLRKLDGVIEPILKPYRSEVLGSLAGFEEQIPDALYYCEDEYAESILTAMMPLVAKNKFGKDAINFFRAKVVPVGGYDAVVRFLDRHPTFSSEKYPVYAVLDGDVRDETLVKWREKDDFANLDRYKKHEGNIKYLPFTPEVGVCSLLGGKIFLSEMRRRLNDPQLYWEASLPSDYSELTGKPKRDAAKKFCECLELELAERFNRTRGEIRRIISESFVLQYSENNSGELLGVLGATLVK
ncbi:AAA family ATPase [Wenxinia saemankumensis]|uniref:AAA family ATPase n=1 Tax=Wenxinia saemankumensis TaxID=1447782 RepID=UPI00147A96E7